MGVAENESISGADLWWMVCKPALAGLLDHAGTYTAQEKEQQLAFFKKHVAPWLGSQPLSDESCAVNPIDAISPLEASLNLRSTGKPIVRYQFEPLRATREGHDVLENRFGLDSVKKLLLEIEPEIQHVDLGWAEQFCQALFPSSMEEMKRVLERSRTELPAPLDHALTFNMALDLKGGGRHLKVYMFPMAKNLATGRERDARDAGLDAVRGLKPYGDRLTPAVDFLDDYWDRCPDKLTLDMIGLDCIDPSNARIKIYAHLSERNSWQVVRDIVTFGGKATDPERLQSLDILHSIWDLLRNEHDGGRDDFDKPLRHPSSFLGSVMFSFEIIPGRHVPEVKVYLPMWQYAPSDGHIAKNLVMVFNKLGWNQAAKDYTSSLRRTFPGADLDSSSSVVHSNVSFAFSAKTGPYMSVYYAVSGKATRGHEKADSGTA
ncbi:uncharacterized protein PgNI_11657 [Pyricularia grisea]|uniref:Aromatic prenyltransferase n=1 Tax=Pyricularia grisea TaxID=148305 RepID=A0A6P8ANH5_PYRGI|nr:uncharacterized protein PgNI_11657 [Pyricularia grisea]TLD03584.1 hypothetical protein PgNI_11657 [Pyricularia grisea]